MKKPRAKKLPRKPAKAKRTGPSKRTAAERKAIDKRAAIASRDAKRKSRKARKVDKVLGAQCPRCLAAAGVKCFDPNGRQLEMPHRVRVQAAAGFKPGSIAAALAPLVTAAPQKPADRAAEERTQLKAFGTSHHSPDADQMMPSLIKVGSRHRKDYGDLDALARSINERGGLIQPVAITMDDELIDGDRRLKAWQRSRFKGQLIPVHRIDIDALVAGEWDANAQRKSFTPEESVAIKRTLESVLKRIAADEAAARPTSSRPAPGRKAEKGKSAGRAADKVAAYVGKDRRTIEKAEAVVEAAEQDPAFQPLVDDMNRTGRVDGPFKRLQVMKATAAMRASPPQMPDNDLLYETAVVDYPWPHEPEMDQEQLDAAGRSTRPYPAMSIKAGCHFMREQLAPRLAKKCTLYFWTTNFHMPYAYQLLAALGFVKPCTMGTWIKDKFGRGRVLRDKTEHCIIVHRGGALIALTDDTTEWSGPGWETRENSRKPKAFYDLVARKSPAPRYLSVFSTGGEGDLWDAYGDQAGRHAVEAEGTAPAVATQPTDAPATDAQVEPKREPASDDELRKQLIALEAVQRSEALPADDVRALLVERRWITGKRKLKLTDHGQTRLGGLRMKFESQVEPAIIGQAAIEEFENADLYRIPAEVIRAIVKFGGHTISRTIDWASGEKGVSVATCQCGWSARADRTLPYSGENVIGPLEEAHWREMLADEANSGNCAIEENAPEILRESAPAPTLLAADDDMPEMPDFLRRKKDEAA